MKLLIITQVIDTEHPILGFFHRWVEEFARHCEHVHVIALQVGKYDLPGNVTVHSLGKEDGVGRLTYIFRFYKLIWQLRHEYDNVFVHMNQIYVILGAPFWRACGKKVGLWYAHGAVTKSLHIATHLAHIVFTSTEQGMRINSPKRNVVGQGIDTKHFYFVPKVPSQTLRLITVGRISKSKNISTLLHACAELKKQKILFVFKVVGLATNLLEERYEIEMKKLAKELRIEDEVKWVGPVKPTNLPPELQSADIFIHDGATDSLDKALLEAVLCGCVVVSSNPSYVGLMRLLTPNYLYQPNDYLQLTKIIQSVDKISADARQLGMKPVQEFVHDSYSISNLISGIVQRY